MILPDAHDFAAEADSVREPWRPAITSRLAAAIASFAILVLIALVLLRMGAFVENDRPGGNFTSISLSQDAAEHHAQKSVTRQAKSSAQHTQPVPQPPQPQPVASPPPVAFIHMSSAEMASADIGKMSHPSPDSQADSGPDGSKAYGPGQGAGGKRLYRAEWYREPTHAELAGYLPRDRAVEGTADIACKTVERFHVENCQELDENPPGSGLARALRQASWQFLVRPPRINGEPQIGAWVQIHFVWRVTNRPDADAPPDN